MRRAWAVALKELRQISRDRRSVLILLFLPAFFLFLYGYALNFEIRHVALGVQDRDDTAESRELTASFVRSTYFDYAAAIRSDAELETKFRSLVADKLPVHRMDALIAQLWKLDALPRVVELVQMTRIG